MAEITGGELLLKCLKQEGVSVMFGILDGSFNPFLAKLEEYGIRFVNARHEAAAAHMAEAWARIRGEPAVVIGGIGPGAANMVSGVVTAYAEGSPLIVLSGQRRRSIIYPDRGGSFQNVDLLGLYRPVTRWCAGVRDWRRLPELIRRAYREATGGRPGPGLPRDPGGHPARQGRCGICRRLAVLPRPDRPAAGRRSGADPGGGRAAGRGRAARPARRHGRLLGRAPGPSSSPWAITCRRV